MDNLQYDKKSKREAGLKFKNALGKYISIICAMRGITKANICENIGVSRPTLARIEKEQAKQVVKRKKIIDKISATLYDNANKLLFISGLNPWIDCLDINDLIAIWEFVERIVIAKKQCKIPPMFYYTTLVNKIFGGASIIDNEKIYNYLTALSEEKKEEKEKEEKEKYGNK